MNIEKNSVIQQLRVKWLRPVWGIIIGALLGFILLHPYVMLLGSIGVIPGHFAPSFPGGWDLKAILALEYSMFVMAAPLAFFGAATGFMAGVYLNRAAKLQQLLLEQEKNAASLEAVKALSATLSHYLLNANMIIGGKVRHCRRFDPPQDILDSLQTIEEQGRTIDAVVGALGEVARVAIIQSAPNQIPMIDLTKNLEERLRQFEGSLNSQGPGNK